MMLCHRMATEGLGGIRYAAAGRRGYKMFVDAAALYIQICDIIHITT